MRSRLRHFVNMYVSAHPTTAIVFNLTSIFASDVGGRVGFVNSGLHV